MNKIKTKNHKVVTSTYVLFKNFKFQKVLALSMSLLLAFSPLTHATAVDYLIGTLGNAFTGQLEGGNDLFEITKGRIGIKDEADDTHSRVEMAGDIAKISAGADNAAYFIIDGAPSRSGVEKLTIDMVLKGPIAGIDDTLGITWDTGYWVWMNTNGGNITSAGITYGKRENDHTLTDKKITMSFLDVSGLTQAQFTQVFQMTTNLDNTETALKVDRELVNEFNRLIPLAEKKHFGLNIMNEGGSKLLRPTPPGPIGHITDTNTGLGYWKWDNYDSDNKIDARGAGITYGNKLLGDHDNNSETPDQYYLDNKEMTISFTGVVGMTAAELWGTVELSGAFRFDTTDVKTLKVVDTFTDRDLGLEFIDENLVDGHTADYYISKDKSLNLKAFIDGSTTTETVVNGEIDGRLNKYTEVRTYDDRGLLWRTTTQGIRGGDVVNSTTYNGYNPAVGDLQFSYTFGATNGALSNYVESYTYQGVGLVQQTIRSGMVGGDTYGDGNLITDANKDYVTTNVYTEDEMEIDGEPITITTLVGIAVTGDINGRKSSFQREFVYDSQGRTVETRYAALSDNKDDDTGYALVNGAFYGGTTPGEQYTEFTSYNSDGSVAATTIEGRIDGMANSYRQSFEYTLRGQVHKTITNGTVRGNIYTNLTETNIIKNRDILDIDRLTSNVNSGRTMATITDGSINGARSDLIARYDYDNDRLDDNFGSLNPFVIAAKDRVGRQIATYTRGLRDATCYGDCEIASEQNYESTYLGYTQDDQFKGAINETNSYASFSEYKIATGQVIKTISGIKINEGTEADPRFVIKGGLINGTENYYATVYKYDQDLGREDVTATRGVRGGRMYGKLDETSTIENLTWDQNKAGTVTLGADYVEDNTYYGLNDTIGIDPDGDGQAPVVQVKYADTHLFRLKSTHTTGWTDGEKNDYVRLLDYDNDGVGITWQNGGLVSDDVVWEAEGNIVTITGTKEAGEGRVARSITGGMVSARCYGNICDAAAADNFDLSKNKDFSFSFAPEDNTSNIYQEVSSYDSQGRVVYAMNLGLINGAKDNYRTDYFYETGRMAGRQNKSVINSKAKGQGNAIVSANVRINYVEETEYDNEDEDSNGKGLRQSVKVTGFDSGAYNNYIQLFEYQTNTDAVNYRSVAGRMSAVRYRGDRASTINGYFDLDQTTLNTALSKLTVTTNDGWQEGWVRNADFVQRLVYAGVNDLATYRLGQQTEVFTEGTSGGSANDYVTVNLYDDVGRQQERKIQGDHTYNSIRINTRTEKVDDGNNDGKGFGIVGGQFTKTNESMEYHANGRLALITNVNGFSETVEEGVIFGGQDNYKRVFFYDDRTEDEFGKADNDFYGRDTHFQYDKANEEDTAPRVSGNYYFGTNQLLDTGDGKEIDDNCTENCRYEIKYTYDARGQRETQHSWGWTITAKNTDEFDPDSAQEDDYTQSFKYNSLGQTASTSYNIGGKIRSNTYGVAPTDRKTGKKTGTDQKYVTNYTYNELGWMTKQQSIGFRGQNGQYNYDNFTRSNKLEHEDMDTHKIVRNNWGRVIDSVTIGSYGSSQYSEDEPNTTFSDLSYLQSLFDGRDDGKDPLTDVASCTPDEPCGDDNPWSYMMETENVVAVYVDNDGDSIAETRTTKTIVKFATAEDEILPEDQTTIEMEFARRLRAGVSGKLIMVGDQTQELDYGDLYKGARPCVRQADGTLNCAH